MIIYEPFCTPEGLQQLQKPLMRDFLYVFLFWDTVNRAPTIPNFQQLFNADVDNSQKHILNSVVINDLLPKLLYLYCDIASRFNLS